MRRGSPSQLLYYVPLAAIPGRLPDIEVDVPDERIRAVLEYCQELSGRYERQWDTG
jgi:hypothetical protein